MYTLHLSDPFPESIWQNIILFTTLIFFLNLCWDIPCSVLTLPRDIGGCQIKSLWQWGSQDHSDAVNILEIDLCFMFRTILSSLDYLRHPFSISVFGGLMYWSEWDTHAIYQVQESTCDTTNNCWYSDVSGWQVDWGQCDHGDQHWQCPPAHGGPGQMMNVITNYLSSLLWIICQVYHPFRQPDFPNLCLPFNGHCSHLCLPSPGIKWHNSRGY